MQILIGFCDADDPRVQDLAQNHFSSVLVSMKTILLASTNGDFLAELLPDYNMPALHCIKAFMFLCTSVSIFCLVPIIIGTYSLEVYDVSKLAAHGTSKKSREAMIFHKELKHQLHHQGFTMEATMNAENIDSFMSIPKVSAFLQCHGVHILGHDAISLIGGGAGETTAEDLSKLCMSLKQMSDQLRHMQTSELLENLNGKVSNMRDHVLALERHHVRLFEAISLPEHSS